MAMDMKGLMKDLGDETDQLLSILVTLEEKEWELPTPAPGWAIRDQVSHLAYFDQSAVRALVYPDYFKLDAAELLGIGDRFPDEIASRYGRIAPSELIQWLGDARAELIAEFSVVDARHRIPWYGPEMSVASAATARLMETWAHGQDIADTLGVTRKPTNRLRHIAHLGYATFAFSHQLRDLSIPKVAVRVELAAPDGSTWSFGPEDAKERVVGTALDFCLVVTQRRNVADTALEVAGEAASRWMGIAQAYAGAAGQGRAPIGSLAKAHGQR